MIYDAMLSCGWEMGWRGGKVGGEVPAKSFAAKLVATFPPNLSAPFYRFRRVT